MKIISGSVRGKSRDLYDLHYMIEELGVSPQAAVAWAQKMRPADWKSARRHRYIRRATNRSPYWDELDGYLSNANQLQHTDKEAMTTVMLDALSEIQKLDKEAAERSNRKGKTSGGGRPPAAPAAKTRYCGHGKRPCRRRVAPGKICPVHGKKPRGLPA